MIVAKWLPLSLRQKKKQLKWKHLNVFIFICCNHLYAVLKIKLFGYFHTFMKHTVVSKRYCWACSNAWCVCVTCTAEGAAFCDACWCIRVHRLSAAAANAGAMSAQFCSRSQVTSCPRSVHNYCVSSVTLCIPTALLVTVEL